MSDFKVGDTVEALTSTPFITRGKFYKIIEITKNGSWLRFLDDLHTQNGWDKKNFRQISTEQPSLDAAMNRAIFDPGLIALAYSAFPPTSISWDTEITKNQKCTCGTKISMGSSYHIDHCSSWCDLRNKA